MAGAHRAGTPAGVILLNIVLFLLILIECSVLAAFGYGAYIYFTHR